jgi:indole-3-glycerol phosphate synthase
MDFLTEIIEKKRARLQSARANISIAAMRTRAIDARLQARPHSLLGALVNHPAINIIAEIKRASASRGEISAAADPSALAMAYERGGAVAISVLTEEDYFQGSLADLRSVRMAVSLPLLRKDFIFDEFQVYEAAAAGADAILLIVAALDDDLLRHLRSVAEDELGMDALIEVHTEAEMQHASDCGATLIGVNNRDLRTFKVSLETSQRVIQEAPRDVVCISESGLRTADDLRRLQALGYRGFLIGETLMRAEDPELALRELLKSVPPAIAGG